MTIFPGLLQGSVTAPPSKSHAHRLLIAAALSMGETRIRCPAENADISATVRCLNALGVSVRREKEDFVVRGGTFAPEETILPCGESGSTLRFLLPLCAALEQPVVFTGEGRLPQRPNGPLIDVMQANGARVSGDGLPLRMEGGLRPGYYALPGNVSSQYFTGLLFALPLLSGVSVLRWITPLESRPYVDLTLSVLREFGVEIEEIDNGFRIPGRQRYTTPGRAEVEGDWSAAAFWLGACCLESRVEVQGLNPCSAQGDKAMLDLISHLGREICVSDVPDLMPILSAVAALTPGETRITGAARLRIKESDRIASMAQTILALGGEAEERPDGLIIRGQKLRGGTVDGLNDHRVVMSAAIAATRCQGPVTILGAQAADKSYPGFFDEFVRLGGRVHDGLFPG